MIRLRDLIMEDADGIEISKDVAENLAAKFNAWQVNVDELRKGMDVEMEHLDTIRRLPELSIMEALALIALDHLKELPDYYSRLEKMESGESKEPSMVTNLSGVKNG